MKRNFIVGLIVGCAGSVVVLMLVGATGTQAAQFGLPAAGAAAFTTITSTQPIVLQPQGGGGPGPVGPAFTYQGMLKQSGAPINTSCDFQFSLWDSSGSGTPPTGGIQIGKTETQTAVTVSNGLFNVVLNFSPDTEFGADAFNGQGRWLAISVRCPAGGIGAYTVLGYRQPLWATPYAMSLMPGAVISGTAYQNLKVMSDAPTGSVPAAVLGEIYNALDGIGVFGVNYTHSFTGAGVFGQQGPGFPSATKYAGVVGKSTLTGGYGVVGETNSTTGIGTGVFGDGGNNGYGVYGYSTNYYAVEGRSTYGDGVYGRSITGLGVYGQSTSSAGVYGTSTSGDGVSGYSASGYAGYFSGNVYVNGNLSKSGGSFKIDDPIDPANKYLYHSFVESPDMKDFYDGVATLDANGEAWIKLPDWFDALNKELRYQLTPVGAAMPGLYIAQEVQDNRFQIAGGVPGKKVSWQVTGTRQDAWANAHRIPVEEDKPAQERGLYIHPELFGQPASMSVNYTRLQQATSAQPITSTPSIPNQAP